MTTTQDYLTHKAAFILSLQVRQLGYGLFSSKGQQISDEISAEFKRWDMTAKHAITAKMSELKAAHPGFDWERNWTKIERV